MPAVQKHEEQFGRVPQLVAGDAGFYSAGNEAELQSMGVRQISVPNRSTKSPERRRHQKKRSFRRGLKWRTGAEGRISVLKRRHGLNRCRYRGDAGMQRWVGFGRDCRQSDQYRSIPGSNQQRSDGAASGDRRQGKRTDGEKMAARKQPTGWVQYVFSPALIFAPESS